MQLFLPLPGLIPLAILAWVLTRQLTKRDALSQRALRIALGLAIALPVTSFLGTLLGVVQTSRAIGVANAAEKQQMLASGVTMAMNTTAVVYLLMVALCVALAVATVANLKKGQDRS
ncbi:MAG: hypothetical protein HN348_07410 [Proteobacteria bacterium]|jgi:hypothetical protein|nr:hypothetical protein [Pseudomonadota bacterium]